MGHPFRFPISELESRLGGTSAAELAGFLRVSSRTVFRYRTHGLNIVQADRAAVAVGYHPAEVWPDWW
jgi:hypothetical protein